MALRSITVLVLIHIGVDELEKSGYAESRKRTIHS